MVLTSDWTKEYPGHFDDTSSMETCYDFLLFFGLFVFFTLDYHRHPSGKVFFVHEPPEQVCGFENITCPTSTKW